MRLAYDGGSPQTAHRGRPALIRIASFRPFRYDPQKISFISRVVAPPFDLIDPEAVEQFAEMSDHNVIRLILGKEGPGPRSGEAYREAAAALAEWREAGVLLREPTHAVYPCQQQFTLGGERYARWGVLCALLLAESPGEGAMPHERTMAGPRADRLRLMEACRAALSPVFAVVTDPNGEVDAAIAALARERPLYEFQDPDGVAYRLFRTTASDEPERLGDLVAPQRLFIADGHHRHETALRYRREHRSAEGPPGSAPEDFLFVFCVSIASAGLKTLATHRLVKAPVGFDRDEFVRALEERFKIERVGISGWEGLDEARATHVDGSERIGCYVAGEELLLLGALTPDAGSDEVPADRPDQWRRLPVTVLQYAVIEPLLGIPAESDGAAPGLRYCQSIEDLYWGIEGGKYDVAFLLPPVEPRTVEEIARTGEPMPPKSTFFYPKIASGLLFYPFEDGESLPRMLGG